MVPTPFFFRAGRNVSVLLFLSIASLHFTVAWHGKLHMSSGMAEQGRLHISVAALFSFMQVEMFSSVLGVTSLPSGSQGRAGEAHFPVAVRAGQGRAGQAHFQVAVRAGQGRLSGGQGRAGKTLLQFCTCLSDFSANSEISFV